MKVFLNNLFRSFSIVYIFFYLIGCSAHSQHLKITKSKQLSNNTCSQKKPLEIDITTHLGDNQTFIRGDKVRFLASTNQNAYLLLIYKNANGEILQLIPSKTLGKGYYKERYYFEIPKSGSGFVFHISEPFGTELLELFASSSEFPIFEGETLNNGFIKLNSDFFYNKIKILKEKSATNCLLFQKTNAHFYSVDTTIITQ